MTRALAVEFGNRQQRFQEFVDPVPGRGAGFDDFDVTAPFTGQ